MTSPDPATLCYVAVSLGLIACATGALSMIAVVRYRRKTEALLDRKSLSLSTSIDERNAVISARLEEAVLEIGSLDVRTSGASAPIGADMGRGVRSRAMQLLRDGLAPASVARTLHLGVKEIDLISAVSEALSIPHSAPHSNGARGRIAQSR